MGVRTLLSREKFFTAYFNFCSHHSVIGIFCRLNVDSFTFHFLLSDDSGIISKNICNDRLFNRTPLARHVAVQLLERALRNSHYGFPVSFSHLISVPPTGRDTRRKPVRSFIPCHLIILGERSAESENLRLFPPVTDFRNFGSRLRTRRPRIKNSK